MRGQKNSTSSANQRSLFSQFLYSASRKKPLYSPQDTVVHLNEDFDGLSRRLGLVDLLLIGIGASIGAGIFVVTGTVAHDVGPGVAISYIAAGLSCVLNAICYAESASRFPAVVGGAYLYSYSAFNELTAFLVFGQLMLDYHIGAASIARSLASYVISLFELFPALHGNIPSWIGRGQEFLGGAVSLNLLAPIFLVLLAVLLCVGVGESSTVNSFMTVTKVVIVIIVVFVGSFEVDVSNWTPFVPNGAKSVLTGATVVFFAYVGFDAVANCAEESKRPQRDLPIGIIGSLIICIVLYVGVCLVITGMVPYSLIGDDAPLAEAFSSKGLKYASILISVGAVVGLTTTLLVGLYVQSRLYLGIGRDGLLPSIFAKVHPIRRTPINSQIWVGIVTCVLAGLFNVSMLSHILSVGTLTGYSVVSASVVSLRWKDKPITQATSNWVSRRLEGVCCLIVVAALGFLAGISYRYSASYILFALEILVAAAGISALYFRQAYEAPLGFSCPWVPILPSIGIFVNLFLFAQLHQEAWVRFIASSAILLAIYIFYGQFNANPISEETIVYRRVPTEPRSR